MVFDKRLRTSIYLRSTSLSSVAVRRYGSSASRSSLVCSTAQSSAATTLRSNSRMRAPLPSRRRDQPKTGLGKQLVLMVVGISARGTAEGRILWMCRPMALSSCALINEVDCRTCDPRRMGCSCVGHQNDVAGLQLVNEAPDLVGGFGRRYES